MSKQVNVRLSDYHVKLIESVQQVYFDSGIKMSQARIIEDALQTMILVEKNLQKEVSDKMDILPL